MILFPAIDLKDGQCVRLREGRMDRATIFNRDPGAQARAFEEQGFKWIHVVDLDGAFAGKTANAGAVARILSSVRVPVQIGGGVRNLESIAYWLDAGATRVILGTAAVRDPAFVREAAREYPERIAVGIDAREGRVAVAGWAEQTEIDAVELAKKFEGAGIAALIVTDIGRDGLKKGVNVDFTGAMADAVSIPVIASGGVRDVNDIHALRERRGRAIHGAILGRALYDGDIRPDEALAAAASA
ncbi:MAG: 1-(5-phosphoribosyl)-5-[(5-phosphoribosylamino)methylideneamino]imidazole-4-carboxamide isomerase [Hyphomonadaceae bacterium]|nr:MAG: phosphoribosylformimino-5-aminoimidazole carboxamide ribotide isomerase [Caulobacteraceae bacterium]MBT9444512.1 1-(5-phosphoribosyl)-5-[(5-phosphoribosylamino)methylideneamino]imidazole-4-carboxamide isomerase [Hyphomonadaceae bacterium]